MKKILFLAIAMLLAAAPVAASDRTICHSGECVFDVSADTIVCADPRVKTYVWNEGTVPSDIRISWKRGNKQDPRPPLILKELRLAAGESWESKWRWTLGHGSKLKVRAFDPIEQEWVRIYQTRIYSGPAWGQGDCIK